MAMINAHVPILEDEDEDPDQTPTDIKELEEDGPFCATFRDMITCSCRDILYEMFSGTSEWLYGQKTKKEKNSGKLFCILFANYLGADHVGHLVTKMETCLANLTYCDKQKNWDRTKYTEAHIK